MKLARSLTPVGSRIFILRLLVLFIGIHFTGTSNAFICTNTNFVKDNLLCDGINDCGDKSDEKSCLNCTGNSFHCTWSLECILNENHCDRKPDCRDESDETSCPCRDEEEFTCTNSDCIRLTNRCDGRKDCTDGSDEKNCSNCTFEAFHCARSQECFPDGVDLANYPDCLETTGGPEILLEVNTTNNVNTSISYNSNCTSGEFYCVKSRECISRNSDLDIHPGCFETVPVPGVIETLETFDDRNHNVFVLVIVMCIVLLMATSCSALARFVDSKYRYSSRMRNCWDLSKIFGLCCPSLKSCLAHKLTKSCRPVWFKSSAEKESKISGIDTLLFPNDCTPMMPMLLTPIFNSVVVEDEILVQKQKPKLGNDNAACREFLQHFVMSCDALISDHPRQKFIPHACLIRPLTPPPEKEKTQQFYTSLGTSIFTEYRDHILAWKAACQKNKTLVGDLGKYAGHVCAREIFETDADSLSEAKKEEILNCFVKSHREFKGSVSEKVFDKNYNIRLFFFSTTVPDAELYEEGGT